MKTTLEKAIHQMKPGDRFKIDSGCSDIHCVLSDLPGDPESLKLFKFQNNEYVKISPDVMLFTGEIIPAEPKVLSCEEIASHIITEYRYVKISDNSIKDAILKADKNGQLREWVRPEQVELRDAINDIIEHPVGRSEIEPGLTRMISYSAKKWDRLDEALQNLKPPTMG